MLSQRHEPGLGRQVEGRGRASREEAGPGLVEETKVKVSLTLPVKNEAHDIEETLLSFRPYVDEIVVGVDPRSTDGTYEICERIADVVFWLDRPQGPPEEFMGEDGVHFSWIRNQCLDRCRGDWIFMTEGHESLLRGGDVLRRVDEILPSDAEVCFVLRTGDGQQWAFPWLFRNSPKFRFTRAIHNTLTIPPGTKEYLLEDVFTRHRRHHTNAAERAVQRKGQNVHALLRDWTVNFNSNSLFYLGQELRQEEPAEARKRLREYIETCEKGGFRYQARLMLAKLYADEGRIDSSADVLINASADDWSRTEHWIWLGDIASVKGEHRKALQFYRYAATVCGKPPATLAWIQVCYYTYVPAMRMVMTLCELGRLEEALEWASKINGLLDEDASEELIRECEDNVRIISEAIRSK